MLEHINITILALIYLNQVNVICDSSADSRSFGILAANKRCYIEADETLQLEFRMFCIHHFAS